MSKRILVIDDEESIRKAFVLALEDSGYEVNTVDSGEKGIEEIKKQSYDLIFLDLKMPKKNGVDTLREIRQVSSEVPIYIVTAFYKEFFGGLQQASEDGVRFELLEKPISGEKIVLTARGVLEDGVSY